MGVYVGFLGGSKYREFAQKLVYLVTTKIPLCDTITPKFDLWALFDCNYSLFNFGNIWRSNKTKKYQF